MDKERLLSIGQMASMNGISVRMLRFYHEKGVLVPAIVEEETGYRYYTLDQCATLDTIQHLQALEIPLKTIETILVGHDLDLLRETVLARREGIEREMARLETERRVCDALTDSCRIAENPPICDVIMFENLPDRTVARFPHAPTHLYEDEEIDAQEADDELEFHLRSVKQHFIDRGYSLALFRNIGCIIPYNHLVKREFSFDYSYAFVYDSNDVAYEDLCVLPGGPHVTLYIEGTHYADGSYRVCDAINKMLDYIDENDMEVRGAYVDEVVAEAPPFRPNRSSMLIKMMIPVKRK